MKSKRIQPATVTWQADHVPFSTVFDDVYFSKAGGIAETEYVFIDHNRLRERLIQLTPGQCFVIAETGFGTGLNFLVAASLFLQLQQQGGIAKDCRLHFISAEKHPLAKSDLQQIYQSWPQFSALCQQVITHYPHLIPGFHRLDLGHVQLTLMFGAADEMFAQLTASVDCWFLDGFAPSKNPDMWTDTLFAEIARLSRYQTTFATFTAAGLVRRQLLGHGFSVSKVKGFGHKRDMLAGHFVGVGPELPDNSDIWFQLPRPTPVSNVAIIGAGIAGTSSAHALRRRNIPCEVFEQHPSAAQEASGNAQGALYIKPSWESSYHNRFYSQAFGFAHRCYQQLAELEWQPCGVIINGWNPKELKRQQHFNSEDPYSDFLVQRLDQQASSIYAGVDNQSGLWLEDGGWVHPPSLCRQWLTGVLVHYDTTIERLTRNDDLSWTLTDKHGNRFGPFSHVILANAYAAKNFAAAQPLPVKAIRGQTSAVAIDENIPLQTVLCARGYVSPPRNGQLNFGATFTLHNQAMELSDADHQENLSSLLSCFPALVSYLGRSPTLTGRVGFRCSSPDYLPIVGPLPDWQFYQQHYQDLNHRRSRRPEPQYLPGVFCHISHGSRGLTSVPLCAEIIASMICNEPLPIEADIINHLHPARFIIKQFKQQR